MTWPAGDQFVALMKRDVPGQCDWNDDRQCVPGTTSIKMKAIPGCPTGRLQRRLSVLHNETHTREGLDAHDSSRRSLVEQSMKTRAIAHELKLRGVNPGECFFCWG